MSPVKDKVLIIGGGVTGLSVAGFLADRFDCLLLEKEDELGGYCRTIYQDGFTWDYSGHFFHFREKWVADYLEARMNAEDIVTSKKRTRVYFRDTYIDYPFQFNIHQLPQPDLLRCLADMHEAQRQDTGRYRNFREMLVARYGASIAELFLIPYTEKQYATSAERLDPAAMGRFFPHVEFSKLLEVLTGRATQPTYNDTFRYHRRGAKGFVDALASYVPSGVIHLGVECGGIDLGEQTVRAGGETLRYDRLVSSVPLPRLLRLCGITFDENVFTANKVLVFNLGFDRPSPRSDHWVYYPDPEQVFYRVGHYDNILGQDRMSLYVEIALPSGAPMKLDALFERTIADLRRCGVIVDHELVSWASVLMDPAYVHVSEASQEAAAKAIESLARRNVFVLGRYGTWAYCSIEDNILSAFNLAQDWGAAGAAAPVLAAAAAG